MGICGHKMLGGKRVLHLLSALSHPTSRYFAELPGNQYVSLEQSIS